MAGMAVCTLAAGPQRPGSSGRPWRARIWARRLAARRAEITAARPRSFCGGATRALRRKGLARLPARA
eukprot:7926044-Alexandrium_andersonii.AAC.1